MTKALGIILIAVVLCVVIKLFVSLLVLILVGIAVLALYKMFGRSLEKKLRK